LRFIRMVFVVEGDGIS